MASSKCRPDPENGARTPSERSPVELSHAFVSGMPGGRPYGDCNVTVALQNLHGHEFAITGMSMSVHTGTHIDAPRHFLPDGKTISEYPWDFFTGPGVVLDMRREGPVATIAEELKAATPAVRSGDIVFLYFGYGHRYATREYTEEHPYLADDVAEFLVDMHVPVLGIDLPTPDLPRVLRGASFGFPVHRMLLSNDCLIIENLGSRLAELAGTRIEVFAAPMLIDGADGAPARVVAVSKV